MKKKVSGRRDALDTDHLVDELRREIVGNKLPPGSRLRENQIVDRFKVSRAKVREAFGVLEERGLIERIPNKGAVVMRFEIDQVIELFDVREVLEGLMVRLATTNSEPDYWDHLNEKFGVSLEEAVLNNDFESYIEAITEFRETCLVAANSATLKGLLDSLYDRVQVMIRRLMLVPGRAGEGLKQHRKIIEAMRDGNAELAEQLKRENIRSARDWFLKYKDFLM